MAEALERTWPVVLIGVLVSFLIEYAARPRPAHPWSRPWSTLSIHIGVWLLAFTLGLAVFRRPWFAAASVDALLFGLVMVNAAKLEALREPFVFQDYEYFTDALRHPRLYIPFFGAWRLALTVASLAGVILLGMWLEPTLTGAIGVRAFALELALLAGAAAALLVAGHRALPRVQHEPAADIERLGMLAFWWRYALDERHAPPGLTALSPFAAAAVAAPRECPDLIAIQSESFFDARRCFAAVNPAVLAHYDAVRAAAAAHGELQVAAWGANTVRTEFAFLSGIDPLQLGVHRFNPYRLAARRSLPSIASYLKSIGYRTVCVHPYPVSFYRRDQVYPRLGFDEFIDVRAFGADQRSGPFTGDQAVADKIGELLRAPGRTQPLFVFAITMENHGPLHLETVEPADAQRLRAPLPPGCDDLLIYLRHLANADRMIAKLRGSLESSSRAASLCFYGDHVPIMASVYAALGNPDGHTDYLIWSPDTAARRAVPAPHTARIEELGLEWLTIAGLADRTRRGSAPTSRPAA
jgi:hypothetical protein